MITVTDKLKKIIDEADIGDMIIHDEYHGFLFNYTEEMVRAKQTERRER